MYPFVLRPNIMERPYRGGSKIAEFRGIPDPGDYHPEDWIGSTTSMFTNERLGLSILDDGVTLRDAIRKDPEGFLGYEHVGFYGPDPGILVKLLDAGERLSVQCHPDRQFAQKFLGAKYGKSEAWIILDTYVAEAAVYVGFKEEIGIEQLERIVTAQDKEELHNLLNRLDISPGDRVFVPGGVPHAIGEGILMIEIQEPSDWLLRLEWKGYRTGSFSNDMGLGLKKALQCVDLTAYDNDKLTKLWVRNIDSSQQNSLYNIENLLPPEANPFFRAERIRCKEFIVLNPGFSILIVTKGYGELQTNGDAIKLKRGITVLTPWSAGETKLFGEIEVIRFLPPVPFLIKSGKD